MRCPDPVIEEANFPICYCLSPNTTRDSQKFLSARQDGIHGKLILLTVPYVHMCSHCNLQVMGCISSCPAPAEDEMDYEKQVRSVHDRDDSS